MFRLLAREKKRMRPAGGVGDSRATTARGNGAPARMAREIGTPLFFFLLFLFFFFPFSPSINCRWLNSPSIGHRQSKSIVDDRLLAEPPGSGRSAYRQPDGPVCITHTELYRSKLQTLPRTMSQNQSHSSYFKTRLSDPPVLCLQIKVTPPYFNTHLSDPPYYKFASKWPPLLEIRYAVR
ncbi:hypothetical protein GW17_00023737 [Ensete ventricosum]|nr:hypothetical protein GW17_00023737 [Ensete ventricosum]